jgi:hypothetical protein
MDDVQHISMDRMLEVATNPDAFFTEAEEKHIRQCDRCLLIFAKLVLNKPLGNP